MIRALPAAAHDLPASRDDAGGHRSAIDRLRERRDAGAAFEFAPAPLWLEDYSALRKLFDEWRGDGVRDLRAHLLARPERVGLCARAIRLVDANRRTLQLFEAASVAELDASLDRVFRDDMLATHVDELIQLWDGALAFCSRAVNYTLSGRRLDVELEGQILPGSEDDWSRVLIVTADVTDREEARRRLAASENHARGLFEHSPVSLWVEDFSAVKLLLDEARERGIRDFRVFTDVHPDFVDRCMSEIRVLDVNRHTLELFGAPDRPTLLNRLGDVFRGDMRPHFREQLIDLWDGKLFQTREVVNYALSGDELNLHMQFSVLPGHEGNWSLVQVALTDITARKRAEAYLEFLGKHDALTKLYNRSFYVDEMNRLERKGSGPVTIVMSDLNGLKGVNDGLGHAAGDALLRRAGEVLAKSVERPAHAARIGGDEFALLLPGCDAAAALLVTDNIARLTELNNQFYPGAVLSFSLGAATATPGERLEDTARRADALMYEAKRAFYAAGGAERRRPG